MATIIYKTIGPGKDYATLSAFEAVNRNCVTNDEIWVGTADNFKDGTAVNFTGWVMDAGHYVLVRAADKHNSCGKITNSAYRLVANSFSSVLQINDIGASGLIIFDGIQIESQGDGVNSRAIGLFNNGTKVATVRFKNCIIKSKTGCIYMEGGATATNDLQIWNSVVIASGGSAFSRAYRNAEMYHCTFVTYANYLSAVNMGPNDGRVRTLKNCYAVGTGTLGSAYANLAGATVTNCASSDSTGTVGLRNIAYSTANFIEVGGGNENLRLQSASALVGAGASLVGESEPWNFTDDIDGDDRDLSAPDIGADEYFSAPPPDPVDYPYSPYIGCFTRGADFPTGQSGYLGGILTGLSFSRQNEYLGCIVQSQVLQNHYRTVSLGGFTNALAAPISSQKLGGFVNALPLSAASESLIGSIASGLWQPPTSMLGGFIYGYPDANRFIETHGRMLTKANSRDVVDQDLFIDAQIVFKAIEDAAFNAKLTTKRWISSDFNAKIKTVRYITPPTVVITNVEYILASGEVVASGSPIPNFHNSARKIRVTASGQLGDATEWSHAYIDFGEPFRTGRVTQHASVSGFTSSPLWTTTHDYICSGVYSIVARGQDIAGCVGSDIYMLNLASGYVAGVDYPAISISAVPQSGWVPPSLRVAFDVATSGIGSISSPTDSRIYWNLGNRETSKKRAPKTYYASPGHYAATCRFRWIHPSGKTIWISDSLLIGYNNA